MAFVFGDYTIETYKNLKTRLRCYDKGHELTESIVLYNYKPSDNNAYICYDINGKRYYIKCLNKKVVKSTKFFYIKKFKNVDAKMISITEEFSDKSKRVLDYILDFESIKDKVSKKEDKDIYIQCHQMGKQKKIGGLITMA